MVSSILVRTNCASRDWHGGCTNEVPTCSHSQVDQIINALNNIIDKVNSCNLSDLTDLKNCIRHANENVVWKCGTLGAGTLAQTSGNEITLTPSAFGSTAPRFEAIVFHEIIHSCGGTELDSEAFENHCYRGNGATAPTSGDFPKFRNDGGNFVNWNGANGECTTKDGQAMSVGEAGFVDPSPPPSSSWI